MGKKNQGAQDRNFDPKAGEGAFKKIEALLRAMPAAEVQTPNSDPRDSAVAALALVDVARDPARAARFSSLPEAVFAASTVDDLELAAWATWFAHTKVLSETAQSSGARVDIATFDAAGAHLAKMLKLIQYHVGDHADVASEITDIRSGIGYQDRASDLTRAAVLWERYQSELENDQRNYDANDATQARSYAEAILQALRASLGSAADWADLRNRAWSRLNKLYAELRAAGVFVFRDEPELRTLFVPLRQAVSPRRPRSKPEPPPAPPTNTAAA